MALKTIPLQATAAQQQLPPPPTTGLDCAAGSGRRPVPADSQLQAEDNLLDHLVTYLWPLWPLSGRDAILVSDVQHVIGCVP